MKVFFLVVVICVAAAYGNVVEVKKGMTSADVEHALNPTVHALEEGKHKLTYKSPEGKDACLVCNPFEGCGCSDIVAIRCELKRLKQKLLRLKSIADPHHTEA
jgi:hypothetical protein